MSLRFMEPATRSAVTSRFLPGFRHQIKPRIDFLGELTDNSPEETWILAENRCRYNPGPEYGRNLDGQQARHG